MVQLGQTLWRADVTPIRQQMGSTDPSGSDPALKPGAQRYLTGRNLDKGFRLIQGDPAKGQTGAIQHPSLLQAKVTLWMLRRVVHQPEMGEIAAQGLLHKLPCSGLFASVGAPI